MKFNPELLILLRVQMFTFRQLRNRTNKLSYADPAIIIATELQQLQLNYSSLTRYGTIIQVTEHISKTC